MSDQIWFVTYGSDTHGPFSAEEIDESLAIGTLKRDSLVWKQGFANWAPLSAHFPAAPLASSDGQLNAGHVQKDQTPLDWRPGAERRTTMVPPLGRMTYVAPSLSAIALVLGGIFFWLVAGGAYKFGSWAFFILITVMVAMLGSWAAASVSWQTLVKHSGLVEQDARWQRGALALSIFFLVVSSAVAIRYGAELSTFKRIAEARHGFDRYSVSVDIPSSSLQIEGLIGPGLVDAVRRNLDVHAGIKSVEITSTGGLVDEALALASELDGRGAISLTARKNCNSACLIVLMSGTQHFADWNMQLGFHEVSAITHLDKPDVDTVEELGLDANRYLLSRGVPQHFLDEAKAVGAGSLNSVPAILLAEAGVIGLVDGDRRISIRQAKTRVIMTGLNSDAEDRGIVKLYSALAGSSEPIAQGAIDQLYVAILVQDTPKAKTAISSAIQALLPKAFGVASVDVLYKYLGVQLKEIRELVDLQQWDTCAALSNGQGLTSLTDLTSKVRDEDYLSLAQIIESADSNNWNVRPLPTWADMEGQRFVQGVLKAAKRLNIDPTSEKHDPRSDCLLALLVFEGFSNQSPAQAVTTYRWLAIQ